MASIVEEDEIDAKVLALKEEGNAFIKDARYSLAAERYTQAINLKPNAILYSNRAQAMIKMESYGLAIIDADKAIALDKNYIKAYYRRGSANFALSLGRGAKLKEARKDFKTVLRIKPGDSAARRQHDECDKIIKSQGILAALEVEEPPKVAIKLSEIPVPSDYTGPRLVEDEDGGITTKPDMEFVHAMIEHFKDQKLIHRKYMLAILIFAREMLKEVNSLMEIPLPVLDESVSETGEVIKKKGHFTVCGDTHGQFYDLCHIFTIGGFPSEANPYLFNGDFVDRGSFSVETVTTLLAIKIACPTAMYMTRGNHETKNMNMIYGFDGEVKAKYDGIVMDVYNEVFQWLPLAAVIEEAVFVVHGGLTTQVEGGLQLQQIRNIERGKEPPEGHLMSDLLWSDPQPFPGRSPSKRGVGYSFGPDYTHKFLEDNNLKYVVRSHEVKDDGYVEEHDGKCITIFSAPNYCDQMGNKGAFIRFEEDMEPKFTQYEAVPHPNVPPMRYAGGSMFGL